MYIQDELQVALQRL